MATITGSEYDHITISDGTDQTIHYLKDVTARTKIDELANLESYTVNRILQDHESLSNTFSAEPVNYYNQLGTVDGVRLRISDLSLVNNSSFSYTGLIPVIPGDIVTFNETIGSNTYGTGFYDSEKIIKSGITSQNSNNPFTIPDGIYWIATTIFTTSKSTFVLNISRPSDNTVKTLIEENDQNTLDRVASQVSLFDISKQTVGYYINSEGTEVASGIYRLSGYIPVIPGQSYYVAAGTLYPNDRFGAFYNSEKAFISVIRSSSESADAGPYIVIAPSEARYMRVCYLNSNENIQRVTAITPSVIVTPQMFGATGDGTTDDTVAFQRALDNAYALYIPTANKEVYKITSTLMVPNTCKRIYGDCLYNGVSTYSAIVFDLTGSSESASTLRNTGLFKLSYNCQALSIGGLTIASKTNGSSRFGTFIDASSYKSGSTYMPDKDISLINAMVTGFYRIVNMVGRGFNAKNCALTSSTRIADFSYIEPNGTDSNQNYPKAYNQRGISFDNCRLHSITEMFVNFVNGHGYGFKMTGCNVDLGLGVILQSTDEAWNWNIVGNVFQGLVYGPSINFKGGAKNCIIANNIFSADSIMRNGQNKPVNFINCNGINGCTVVGNVFHESTGDAIVIGTDLQQNAFIIEKATESKSFKVSTMEFANTTTMAISDYISVSPGDIITVNQTLNSNTYGTALFDANGTLTGGIPSTNSNSSFVIPDGVFWIVTTVSLSTMNDFTLYISKSTNGLSIIGNTFDNLPDGEYYPVHFKNNATNVAFAGNTETSGRTLYAVDSGYTVGIYSNEVT